MSELSDINEILEEPEFLKVKAGVTVLVGIMKSPKFLHLLEQQENH